MFVDTVWVYPS